MGYDMIDSRELADELATLLALDDDERDEEDDERIEAIQELEEEIGDLSQGITLVAESDFEEFVQDDLPQIVEIPDFIQAYIDWERLARDYQMDWSSVTFDGTDYLYRG